MNNLPTLKDVISFIKDNLKIIISTMVVCILIYALGLGYTLYTNSKVDDLGDVPSGIESGSESGSVLSPEKVEKLKKDSVSFEFYVETKEANQFTNYNLMKQLLIAPSVLGSIEETAGTKILPAPNFAVHVSLDHSTYILTLSIGTGNYEDNMAIATAYYDGMKEGTIPFFSNNKSVYMVSDPMIVSDKLLAEDSESTLAENEGTSVTTMLLLGVVVLIASFILGVIIALAYSMTRKEISDSFSYVRNEDDIILNFHQLNNGNQNNKISKIAHAVLHPERSVKVVLTESILDDKIVNELKESISFNTELPVKNELAGDAVVININDITELNPRIKVDEFIFICEVNKTTKNWYREQRLQMENYDAIVKVIQV